MKGRLIVIEGLDGSGKATQAALLTKVLEDRGVNVREVSFPAYESDSSALVKMYLSGAFGNKPEDVNAYAASSFYAVDRYASFKTDWGGFYLDGGTVIADRYATSNAIHQCAKLPKKEWEKYLDWLTSYEYGLLGIPAPDAVIYLRTEPEISQALMSARYEGDEGKKDIHEKDPAFQLRSLAAADWCASVSGWLRVECLRDGKMRSVEDIHREILALLNIDK